MIPGLGGMNPGQMKAMMRQMGIQSEDLDVKSVRIECTDGKIIIIENASVNAITMKGQKSYTVSGTEREEMGTPAISDEDVDLVVEKTGCSEADARAALEETNGDIAEAIQRVSEK